MCGENSTTEIIEEALEDGMKEDVTNPDYIEVLPDMTLRMLGWRFFRVLPTSGCYPLVWPHIAYEQWTELLCNYVTAFTELSGKHKLDKNYM